MGDLFGGADLAKRLNCLIKEEKRKSANAGLIIALSIVGGLTILGIAAYLFLRLTGRLCYVDDYDLYDDLDNYYEDDDEDEDDSEDFAE